jgi:hypothetical protein
MMKYYLTFTNPLTGEREVVWFWTNHRRVEYRNDLQQYLGTIAIKEWEEVTPMISREAAAVAGVSVRSPQTSTVNLSSPDSSETGKA